MEKSERAPLRGRPGTRLQLVRLRVRHRRRAPWPEFLLRSSALPDAGRGFLMGIVFSFNKTSHRREGGEAWTPALSAGQIQMVCPPCLPACGTIPAASPHPPGQGLTSPPTLCLFGAWSVFKGLPPRGRGSDKHSSPGARPAPGWRRAPPRCAPVSASSTAAALTPASQQLLHSRPCLGFPCDALLCPNILSVSVPKFPSSHKDTSHRIRAHPTPIQSPLNYTHKDSISKSGCTH